jgi:glycosyltransferase involved in cell wall biosynthesis
MESKVSVIVPVYRVEQYLPACVDSILGQSYRNIELILVDDGSDDGCPSLCDAYAAADARVRCIHKQNGGQSFARRDGVAAATGDYFLFADSDDWLEPDAIRRFVGAAQEQGADIVCSGYRRVYPGKIFDTPLCGEKTVYTGGEVRSLQRRLVGPVGDELSRVEAVDRLTPMWAKLYSARAVAAGKWVSERETGSLEDAIFNLYAFRACEVCVLLPDCLYDYRKDNRNATTVRYRPKLAEQWERVYAYMEEFMRETDAGDEYRTALSNRIALGCLGLSFNEIAGRRPERERRRSLKTLLRQERRREALDALDYSRLPRKWRIFYGLCRRGHAGIVLTMIRIISRLRAVRSR